MPTLTSRVRVTLDRLAHGTPHADDVDADFCYECNTVTRWDAETCRGCGREWGHPPEPRATRVARREHARRLVAGVQTVAMVVCIGVGAYAVAHVGADILAEREVMQARSLPACATEDSVGPCFWDADARVNGQGRSFYVIDDVVHYLPTEAR